MKRRYALRELYYLVHTRLTHFYGLSKVEIQNLLSQRRKDFMTGYKLNFDVELVAELLILPF
jgi:hypothetical protein